MFIELRNWRFPCSICTIAVALACRRVPAHDLRAANCHAGVCTHWGDAHRRVCGVQRRGTVAASGRLQVRPHSAFIIVVHDGWVARASASVRTLMRRSHTCAAVEVQGQGGHHSDRGVAWRKDYGAEEDCGRCSEAHREGWSQGTLIVACQHASGVRLALCRSSQHETPAHWDCWTTLLDGGCGGDHPSISVRQVKSCLVFEKTALPADSTAWVAGR